MGKYSYLLMNLFLFTPLYLFLIYKKIIHKSTICLGFVVGAVYFFIVDPFAVVWQAWQFNPSKTLSTFFGPTLVEELIWSILAFGIVATLTRELSNAEEKGISFRKLLKK